MKKTFSLLTVSLCLFMLLGGPAYAGSLNANESELIEIITGTYEYEGVTYKVKDLYVNMAIDYLMQDGIDLTVEQKQVAIQKMYSSVAQGISEGYLEVVKDVENDEERPGAADGKSDAGQDITGQGTSGSAGLGTVAGTESVSDIQGTDSLEVETTEPESEEATKSPLVLSLESLAQMETQQQEASDSVETNRFLEEYPHYNWQIAWYLCAIVGLGTIGCAAVGVKLFLNNRG